MPLDSESQQARPPSGQPSSQMQPTVAPGPSAPPAPAPPAPAPAPDKGEKDKEKEKSSRVRRTLVSCMVAIAYHHDEQKGHGALIESAIVSLHSAILVFKRLVERFSKCED